MTRPVFSTHDMLAQLVRFDTTSAKSNLELIHWVQTYLNDYGIAATLIADSTGQKASLHATIGPPDKAGVILSGHTDVVPVEGQDWSTDPFKLHAHDGLLYGRGTCDMKGFIATALARVPAMADGRLKKPVHFALSYDEEVGCLGVHDLCRHIVNDLPCAPALCIVGEPTEMKPVTGNKGAYNVECIVHGKEIHSSLCPYGVNAVEAGAELITYIRSIAKRMEEEGPFNKNFEPPFTTVHTGIARGGTAKNIVPKRFDITFEIRNVPETDADALLQDIREYAFRMIEPRMKSIDPTTGFQIRVVAKTPAFDISNNDPAVAQVLAFSGANTATKVSFATEAGVYQNSGIPTVICGPGSIAQAHKPDEFVSEDQLLKCGHFLDRMLDSLRRDD